MDFATAVKTLVEVHGAEVRNLQQEIASLRTSLNDSTSRKGSLQIYQTPDSASSASWREFLPKPQASKASIDALPESARRSIDALPESHTPPLPSPTRIAGAGSNYRGHSPQRYRSSSPPQAPRVSSDNERWNGVLNPRESDRERTDTSQRTVEEGSSNPADSKGLDIKATGKTSLLSETSKRDSKGVSFEPNASDCDFDVTDDGADVPGELTADWIQRWVQLADGLMHNREFIVHPGWTPEFYERLSDRKQSGVTRQQSLHSSAAPAVSFAVTYSQKAALHKQEQSMMSSRSRTVILGRGSGARRSFFPRLGRGSKRSSQSSQITNYFISHPASPLRRFWVVLCVFVIIYEVFAITVDPFDVFHEKTERVIEWITLCYWSTDIVVNFMSGIYIGGKVERRCGVIARHYLRTWFTFDLVVVLSQAIPLIANTGDLDATTFFKIVRCVRTVRLARVFYWMKDELGMSNTFIAGGKMVQMFLCLVFFLHCSACIWYEVGKADNGWANRYEDELGSSPGLRYLASLNWALSQLQGNTNIYPGATFGDRFFAVISSYSSILALTFFVSSMTDTLFSERARQKSQIDENRLIVKFFGRHDINPEICARAEHYLQLKQKQQHWMEGNEQDNKVLAMFPAPLRALLLSEMRAFSLTWHPIFAYLQTYHRSLFIKSCSKILSNLTFEPSDDIFSYGEIGSHAFYFVKGIFVFNAKFDLLSTMAPWIGEQKKENFERCGSDEPSKPWFATQGSAERESAKQVTLIRPSMVESDKSEESMDNNKYASDQDGLRRALTDKSTDRFVKQQRPVRRLRGGDTISEVSLWLSWVHAGDLCSLEYGEAMLISTSELITLLTNHPNDHAIFAAYATRFSKAAKQIRQVNNTDQLLELTTFSAVLEIEEEQNRQERVKNRMRNTLAVTKDY